MGAAQCGRALAVPAGTREAPGRAGHQACSGQGSWSGHQPLLQEIGVCDVFCKDVLLKMNSSLGFTQALTPGSEKIAESIKHQCSSSAECLGVRVQYLDGFARQNTLCHSGLSKSPVSQELHKFLC